MESLDSLDTAFARVMEEADETDRPEVLHMITFALDDDDPRKPAFLYSIGCIFRDRHEAGHLPIDLETAISSFDRSVRLTPDFDPKQGLRLTELALVSWTRFKNMGDVRDIDTACFCFETSLLNEPPGVQACRWMSNLGGALSDRFARTGAISDLSRAIQLLQQAVEATPEEDPNRAAYLNHLGTAFSRRFGRLGNASDIDLAISANQQAVELSPDEHLEKHSYLNNLGAAFQIRFDRLGDVSDLEVAISLQRQAVGLIPDGHPDKPACLNSLGITFERRFDRIGDVSDLESAISLKREVVQLTAEGHPSKPNRLNGLGTAFETRFDRLGDVSDLEAAISFKRQAIALNPDRHPDEFGYLSGLSNCFTKRFNRTGNVSDLDGAISLQRQAAELISDEHPDKAAHLNNLGAALQTRFNRLDDISDLESAISLKKKAVQLTPKWDPSKPGRLSNLGNAYEKRFSRIKHISDLEAAIFVKRQAVELTPDKHPAKPGRLNNLGSALSTRFDHLGDVSDMEAATSVTLQAVELAPDGHPTKPSYLNNLGAILLKRFKRIDDVSDLQLAVTALEISVKLTPDSHVDKPSYLWNLTDALMNRFQRQGYVTDLEAAIKTISSAAQSLTGLPRRRLEAARWWSELVEIVDDEQQIFRAYDCAVGLIPRVAWMGLPIESRHRELEQIGELVRKAAAAAVRSENYDQALEWLEQGRSVVWGQTLQTRSPLDLLRECDARRADRLAEISRALESNDKDAALSAGMRGERLRALVLEWDALMLEVRKLEGFEDFLGPNKVAQLLTGASSFPIVVLNAHKAGCDALVLMSGADTVVHIPLDFDSQRAQRLLSTLESLQNGRSMARYTEPIVRHLYTTRPATIDPDTRIASLLTELWIKIVEPVLNKLAFSMPENKKDDLPRICWCPTGPLSFLPLHAAGVYDGVSPGRNIFDYVVSSYTPTITALLHSHPKNSNRPRILAVAQSATYGQMPLPNAGREVDILRYRAMANGVDIAVTSDKSATVKHVLDEMSKYHWIHFACHGTQDLDSPTKSAFLLSDGKLELAEIIKHPLPRAEFAFLSACKTATGDEKLSEEAVHLTAGMMLAGYRSVIATMWSIRDQDGPFVAEVVYAEMLKDGKAQAFRAAYALHKAVQKLRMSGAPFLAWIPFIHMGT